MAAPRRALSPQAGRTVVRRPASAWTWLLWPQHGLGSYLWELAPGPDEGSPTLNLGDFLSSREVLSSLPGRDDIADTPEHVLRSAADP